MRLEGLGANGQGPRAKKNKYPFLKVIVLLCINMFCEMFYLLHYYAFARLKCFCVLLKLMYLLPNTIQYNGILWMETQLNMKLQGKYLQNDNWMYLLKCWHEINLSYKVLNNYWYVWVHVSTITRHSLTVLIIKELNYILL